MATVVKAPTSKMVSCFNCTNRHVLIGAKGLAGILQLLRLIDADVLLLSEVARGCEDNLNGAKAIAEALEMEFAYGIAFYNFRGNLTECTDGNAILSKYPLSDVEYFQVSELQMWHNFQDFHAVWEAKLEIF